MGDKDKFPVYIQLRDFAWQYFSQQGEHRLKSFNFYLILCAAFVAGAAHISEKFGIAAIWPMTGFTTAISFIFAKLDGRNRELMGHAEAALKAIEQEMTNSFGDVELLRVAGIFRIEAEQTKLKQENNQKLWQFFNYFTYSRCFRWVFWLFGFGSFGFTAYSLYAASA